MILLLISWYSFVIFLSNEMPMNKGKPVFYFSRASENLTKRLNMFREIYWAGR